MNWDRFTRVTPVAGIAALSLAAGLAVSACGAAASGTAAGTGLPGATTSMRPAAAASAPGATPSASASRAPAAGAGTTAPPSAPAAASSSASAPGGVTVTPIPVDGPFVVWDCLSRPQVRPASYLLACADGNDELIGLHWTDWVPPGAAGTGVQSLNDCTPNCASGRFHDYPVDISLSGGYRATPSLPFAYTTITLTYTGPRPTVYVVKNGKVVATHPGTWTEKLPPYVGHRRTMSRVA